MHQQGKDVILARHLLVSVLTIIFWTAGCVQRECLIEPPPAGMNPAVRSIAVVVVTDPLADRRDITEVLTESFDIFTSQTGIRLGVVDWKEIDWRASSRSELLQELADEMRGYEKHYDLVIAFYEMDIPQELAFNVIGGWVGAIDDVYRKFIVVRRRNVRVVVHELGHAFLFQHVHTTGVMSSFLICAAGDHLCVNESLCFIDDDIREIERNRWRDFREKPDLRERQDLIKGYDFVKTPLTIIMEFVSGL